MAELRNAVERDDLTNDNRSDAVRNAVVVRIKNVGMSPRVVYSATSAPVTFGIGKTEKALLRRADVHRIIAARDRGGDLIILDPSATDDEPKSGRVRLKPGKDDKTKGHGKLPKNSDPIRPDITTPLQLLNIMADADHALSYNHFLSVATRILPEKTLPMRPKKEQILKALGDAAKE